MIDEKRLKLINKINKDLQIMCSCSDAEKVGFSYLRIIENLRNLCVNVTGISINEILEDLIIFNGNKETRI